MRGSVVAVEIIGDRAKRTRLAISAGSSVAPRPRLRKPAQAFLKPNRYGNACHSNFTSAHSRPKKLWSGTAGGMSDVARSM